VKRVAHGVAEPGKCDGIAHGAAWEISGYFGSALLKVLGNE
jgi:hypothetical protein